MHSGLEAVGFNVASTATASNCIRFYSLVAHQVNSNVLKCLFLEPGVPGYSLVCILYYNIVVGKIRKVT